MGSSNPGIPNVISDASFEVQIAVFMRTEKIDRNRFGEMLSLLADKLGGVSIAELVSRDAEFNANLSGAKDVLSSSNGAIKFAYENLQRSLARVFTPDALKDPAVREIFAEVIIEMTRVLFPELLPVTISQKSAESLARYLSEFYFVKKGVVNEAVISNLVTRMSQAAEMLLGSARELTPDELVSHFVVHQFINGPEIMMEFYFPRRTEAEAPLRLSE